MAMTACRAALSHGRWHFQHGPIDLIVGADGPADAVADAHERAWSRFRPLLDELVAELPGLRLPIRPAVACELQGPVAHRMWAACRPYAADAFITPMAAVAGAVAEEVLTAYDDPRIERAWVNNGGDVALRLLPGRSFEIGLQVDPARFDPAYGSGLDGRFRLDADRPVRGLATSGWRGRSHSRGIADSVTVLAATASMADAAATLVANAVDLDDARIVRAPACELKDDSDLGTILVTVDVPPLEPAAIDAALASGVACALRLRRSGLIDAALLVCQHRARIVAPPERAAPAGRSAGERAVRDMEAPGRHAVPARRADPQRTVVA